MQDWPERERYTAEDLLQIIRILRDRENGCPWDKVQTHASIRKNFLEETCEALEAIDADDAAMMREELGDVLFAAVRVASTLDKDPEQALHSACEKFIKRFTAMEQSILASGRTLEELSREELLASWDAQKRNGR